MSAPTPTPWIAAKNIGEDHYVIGPLTKDSEGGSDIWTLAMVQIPSNICTQASKDEASANAALIVRAVNSHSALVEACEAALDLLDPVVGMNNPPIPPTSNEVLAKARAALALARGQGGGK